MSTLFDDLSELGDLIVGWTRPMSEEERMSCIRQWWIDKGEHLLEEEAVRRSLGRD